MITPPKPDDGQIDRFTEKPYWEVGQIWGATLILGLGDKLNFERIGPNTVKLTVTNSVNKFLKEIDLAYTAEQLCTTHDEIDLVFQMNHENELIFDQDHEDNGAPSNGGTIGTG